MSDLSKIGGPRRRRRGEKTAEQIERDKKLNRERVARHREKAAQESATFVPGENCKVLVHLDSTDSRYLGEAMRIRALWSPKAYTLDEYIQTLIIRDRDQLTAALAATPPCEKCGKRLPDSCDRLHYKEHDCILTTTARGLAL